MRRGLIVLLGLGVVAGYGSALGHAARWHHGGYGEGSCGGGRWSQRWQRPAPEAITVPIPSQPQQAPSAPVQQLQIAPQQAPVVPQIIIVTPQAAAPAAAPTVIVQPPAPVLEKAIRSEQAKPPSQE